MTAIPKRKTKKLKVSTVGYEGHEIDDFVTQLQGKRIQALADLRKNPLSRKPGFSKTNLAARLDDVGIEYIHLAALGVPSEWRRQARAGKLDRKDMFRDYEKKILNPNVQEIESLRSLLRRRRLVLLCYEAEASDCHRRNVSRYLQRIEKRKSKQELEVVDLRLIPGKSLRR